MSAPASRAARSTIAASAASRSVTPVGSLATTTFAPNRSMAIYTPTHGSARAEAGRGRASRPDGHTAGLPARAAQATGPPGTRARTPARGPALLARGDRGDRHEHRPRDPHLARNTSTLRTLRTGIADTSARVRAGVIPAARAR